MVTPEWLDPELYPFTSRWHAVDAGRMHYVDEGAGPPVIFVHGNPTWSLLYRNPIRRLSGSHRCVAPDHLGFGLSDKPPGWSYRPRDHARNLASLLNVLALDPAILVVHDWGGPIGLSWALDRPDAVRGIVLLNTWMWPVADQPRFRAFSRLLGSGLGRLLIRRFNLFARVVMKAAYADPSRLTPCIHRHYRAPLDTGDARRGSAIFPREILGSTPWLRDLWSRRAALDGIPLSAVWGMEDPAFRAEVLERWREAFPDATVRRLDGVGHYVPEEAPEAVARAVEEMTE